MIGRPPLKQQWSECEVKQLRRLAAEKVPTRDIATKLRRTVKAVQDKAKQEGIALAGIRRGRRIEKSN